LLHVYKRFRRHRKPFYEVTCDCGAYKYPHRFLGGRCSLSLLAEYFFNNGCEKCELWSVCDWSREIVCKVVHGGEDPRCCPMIQEVLDRYEIKIN